MRLPDYQCIEGTVDRILGSHRTTDVNITESTTTHHPVTPDTQYRTETHTFVNTSREFVMLLEVKGRTLRLVSNDYIAVAVGDEVRAICEPVTDAPLMVRDWCNTTRSIRFRTVQTPLEGAGADLAWAGILVFIGAICLFVYLRYDNDGFKWGALGAVIMAALLALYAMRTADHLARINAELDRLGGVKEAPFR